MFTTKELPPQQLPFSKKTKEWRKKIVDWADDRTFATDSVVRDTILHKKINYRLFNGELDREDMQLILNPDNLRAGFIPDRIQHYPIINSKLNVLRGEEAKRRFDYRVIVTNANAISDIEREKKEAIFADLQALVQQNVQSEDEFNDELERINQYYTYEWQDLREIRANALLNHYVKELGIPVKFNCGFMDACIVGEEIYACDIVGGEPTFERINPIKLRGFSSGYSNRIEDFDIITIEDYWSVGKIYDTFGEELSAVDMKYLEELPHTSKADNMDNIDERKNFLFVDSPINSGVYGEGIMIDSLQLFTGVTEGNNYIDPYGNIKVLRVYWKSRRKIKRVKSYDQETGEATYAFYPETYIINKDLGEEEKIFWINEAWEGTKIGDKIYVNMRPRIVQYNRLSNPSRCHFGIIGTIYNINDNRPFSMVDMMKPYNYLYDAVHDRLNKAIAANWGKLLELDFASVPKGWDIEKWMYYARTAHIAVKDSFKEGNIGAATGKLAGAFAANSRGAIDAETGNYIQNQVNLLEFIKMEMSEVVGITKQREGQISNRETVGGVERATLQSSHITEWIFTLHDDLKRRALECLIETAKIALRGRSKKFRYILDDFSLAIMDIPGDEFAENDYGLVVDNSPATNELSQKLDALAQAALQNQSLSFSTIMKIYSNQSLAEIQRLIEKDEAAIQERAQQQAEADREAQMRQAELVAEQQEADRAQRDEANIRDNDTRLMVAQINSLAKDEAGEEIEYSQEAKDRLMEQIREFDEKIKFDREKLDRESQLKEKQISAMKHRAASSSK